MPPQVSSGAPSGPTSRPRIALCHEWLNARHGSEKTFEAMAAILPGADVYALTSNPSSGLSFGSRRVSTTFVDRIPGLRNRRMLLLPMMPLAWRFASRQRYDVVVTSSHACVKGFWPGRKALHLSYCYTPMRYVWMSDLDRRRPRGPLSEAVASRLRAWDRAASAWVDEFAAISTTVQARIAEVYGRTAKVIYPPVDVDLYTPDPGVARPGFAVAVSRLVGYKRLDLAIEACHRVGHPLVVAGAGTEEAALRELAARLRADVRFVIGPTDADLCRLYRQADLLVFPAEEDFGIVPVEAQACGTPVVALGRGGTLDTVLPGRTGYLVAAQDADAFAHGIETTLNAALDPVACRENAVRFSTGRFNHHFLEWVVRSAAARGLELKDLRTAEAA